MYSIGIDFGGSSCKTTVINNLGEVVFTCKEKITTISDANGKVTQNPNQWSEIAFRSLKNVLKSGIDKNDIDVICFDGATHTCVLLGEDNNPIMDCVYWTDTRCKQEVKFLKEKYKDEIFSKCKHYPETIWSLPELLFIKNNFPHEFKKIKHILFCKDYVRFQFVNRFVTDYIEAEGSMLFDFDNKTWDENLLSIVGLTKEIMPEILKPSDVVGTINEKVAKEIGLSTKTKVLCGSTDTAFEVFASGGVELGATTVKLATAGRICLVLDKYVADPNIINYSHIIDGLYYPGSATKACASSFKWFNDNFNNSKDPSTMSNLVKDIPVGSNGLLYLPYLVGELTPIGDPDIRGGFLNISMGHTKAHFARAIMEGVALSLYDCMSYLKDKGLEANGSIYILGGGGNVPEWKQIVSDTLGVKLLTTKYNDSSYGNALFAGVAAGYFKSPKEAFDKSNKIIDTTIPNLENHAKYIAMYQRYIKAREFLKGFKNNE